MNCKTCGQKLESAAEARRQQKELIVATRQVNEALHQLGQKYHDYIPVFEVDSALVESGFEPMNALTDFVHQTRTHEPVGHGKYLSLSWYKMESGRYEIVAYVN